MIYYLAQPYSADPQQAYINALGWVNRLRQLGKIIFSPILHTHTYHHYWSNYGDSAEMDQVLSEDYVAWDLKLLDALRHGRTMAHGNNEWHEIGYDLGVTVLLSQTAYICKNKWGGIKLAYRAWKEDVVDELIWASFWNSDGCRREYEYAKTNHIRVLDLDAYLQGREQEV